MAFGYDPTTIVLTPEEEEAARQAAQGTTPPPAPPPEVAPAPAPAPSGANPNGVYIPADPAAMTSITPAQAGVPSTYVEPSGQTYDPLSSAYVAPPPASPPPTTGPTSSNGGNLVAQAEPGYQRPSDLVRRTYESGGTFAPIAQGLRRYADTAIGDPLTRYQDANTAYETGTTLPTPTTRGESVTQDLVDLQHSGLAQFLGGLRPGAAAAPAGFDTTDAPAQPSYIPTDRTQAGDFVPQSPSEAGPLADLLPPPRGYIPAATGKNIVTTSYPATGTTTVLQKKGAVSPYYPIQVGQTYRSIPPEGSTYPPRETAYGIPPVDKVKLQAAYDKGVYPDVEPRFQGEGPLGDGPPTPGHRQVPYDIFSHLLVPFWRGEGNMGYHDPLANPEETTLDRPIPGAGNYTPGMGETTPDSTWRPGFGSPYTPEQEAAARAKAGPDAAKFFPPPGYVPEIWNAKGKKLSSYWLEKAPEPEVIPVPAHESVGQTETPGDQTRRLILEEMDRRRRERGLRGLFGGS
jgi:hypothetical protein